MEAKRDGGKEGWRQGGMEVRRDGGKERMEVRRDGGKERMEARKDGGKEDIFPGKLSEQWLAPVMLCQVMTTSWSGGEALFVPLYDSLPFQSCVLTLLVFFPLSSAIDLLHPHRPDLFQSHTL